MIRSALYAFIRLFVRNPEVALPLDAAFVRSIKKILVLRYDRLGDMVVTTPMLRLLAERLPHAEIHVMASPRNAGLLAENRSVACVHVWDGSLRAVMHFARLFRHEARRGEGFDLALCTVFNKMTFAGAFVNLLLGRTPLKITLRERRAYNYAVWFNAQVPIEREQPMSALLVQLGCAVFGWEDYAPELVRFQIKSSAAQQQAAQRWFEQAFDEAQRKQECVLYNLSAGAPVRQWSLGRHEAFLRLFTEQFPFMRVVVSSASAERPIADALAATFPALRVLPATDEILQLCAYFEGIDAVITPDTSISHIATAFQKPLVALYTHHSAGPQWMPFALPHRALIADGDLPVESIAPERVLAAFVDLHTTIHKEIHLAPPRL
jgi:ADP-heptose:LPS heptosyltransferase